MNPRYIFAVSHHTLIHGGLGHRPLLYEELVLIWDFIAYLLFLPFSNHIQCCFFWVLSIGCVKKASCLHLHMSLNFAPWSFLKMVISREVRHILSIFFSKKFKVEVKKAGLGRPGRLRRQARSAICPALPHPRPGPGPRPAASGSCPT